MLDMTIGELKPWDDEITLADDMMNVLAGWKDSEGNSCKEGEPSEGSVFNPAYKI